MEWKYSDEIKAKRKRLLFLSQSILDIVGDGIFVRGILPEEAKAYLPYGPNPRVNPDNLKYIFYARTGE